MANVDSAHGFNVEGSFIAGAGIPQWKGRVRAGSTFTIGDPIRFSNGLMGICAATDIVAGVSAQPCASLAEGTEVKYVPAFPWIIFSGQTSGALTLTQLHTVCDMEGTTGIFEVNEDANTNKTLRIIGRKDVGNTSLGTWAHVYVVFLKSIWTGHYGVASLSSVA